MVDAPHPMPLAFRQAGRLLSTTCSQYALDAVREWGWSGTLALWRILAATPSPGPGWMSPPHPSI
jgi:putative component of membrane protein insertase Oxa1/YidC/SpoIIIJ protein YidD